LVIHDHVLLLNAIVGRLKVDERSQESLASFKIKHCRAITIESSGHGEILVSDK
jgi:hypothetical protein